jgi:hypothetical protein
MSTIQQTNIGEISVSHIRGAMTRYSIPCHLKKPCRVNCVLLDRKGVTLLEQNSLLPAGKSNIAFQLPGLKPGNYNFWIKIEDQMYLRTLQITTLKSNSLFRKLKNSFM